jgi:hypothetical protein
MQVCEFNAQIYTSSIRNNALHDFILNWLSLVSWVQGVS